MVVAPPQGEPWGFGFRAWGIARRHVVEIDKSDVHLDVTLTRLATLHLIWDALAWDAASKVSPEATLWMPGGGRNVQATKDGGAYTAAVQVPPGVPVDVLPIVDLPGSVASTDVPLRVAPLSPGEHRAVRLSPRSQRGSLVLPPLRAPEEGIRAFVRVTRTHVREPSWRGHFVAPDGSLDRTGGLTIDAGPTVRAFRTLSLPTQEPTTIGGLPTGPVGIQIEWSPAIRIDEEGYRGSWVSHAHLRAGEDVVLQHIHPQEPARARLRVASELCASSAFTALVLVREGVKHNPLHVEVALPVEHLAQPAMDPEGPIELTVDVSPGNYQVMAYDADIGNRLLRWPLARFSAEAGDEVTVEIPLDTQALRRARSTRRRDR